MTGKADKQTRNRTTEIFVHRVWETQVQTLGREDPLEKGVATHAGTLAWRIPWTEEPDRPQSTESQRAGHN